MITDSFLFENSKLVHGVIFGLIVFNLLVETFSHSFFHLVSIVCLIFLFVSYLLGTKFDVSGLIWLESQLVRFNLFPCDWESKRKRNNSESF